MLEADLRRQGSAPALRFPTLDLSRVREQLPVLDDSIPLQGS